jgi:tetratricopeptide (TPR) repeat protein
LSARSPSRSPGRRREWLVLLAILAVTAAVYARGVSGELVYDDRLLIARNPLITDLGNLPRLFTSGYWDFLDVREVQYIGYWRPLTALVQALVWPFGGAAPAPYHVASLLLHLVATVAAFLIPRRLGASPWVAAATALLFALHPAQVESVAWIAALNDPLFGALALLSMERFLAWRERGSRGIPLAGLAFFALALLAKELAAALVPLLFLLDLLRPRAPHEAHGPEASLAADLPRPFDRWLGAFHRPTTPARAYGPFAAAFAVYMVARMLVFASPWAGFDRITTDFVVGPLRLALLRLEIFGGALEILALPLELNAFRPFRPHVELLDGALVRAAAFTAVFVALLISCLLGRRRLALAALIFVPAGLLPPLMKVQSLGLFPLSERFLYLPVFGFAFAAALLLERALARPRPRTLAVLVLAALYGVRSYARIGVWRDEETLFRDAAERSPRSPYVLWGLGRVLLERMNATRDPRFLVEAQTVFARAEELLDDARDPETDVMVTSRDFLQVNLGNAWSAIYAEDYSAALLILQELVQRIEDIQAREREARALGIRVREQFLDLDKVLTALGVAQYKSGDHAAGERSLERALELQPSAPETHQNLGRLYASQGRWTDAVQAFRTAARLRPGNAEDRLLLAQALQTMGATEEAETLARDLVDELPERAEPLILLAAAELGRGEPSAALDWIERALALDARNALAWYHKARAQLLRGDARAATSAFRNAVELDPASFEAHYDFAAFLLSQGAIAEATPYLVRAYEHAPAQHRAALRRNLEQLELAPDEWLALARVDTARAEDAAALAWLERLLAAEPGHADARLRRARLLRSLERDDEAVAAFRALASERPESFELAAELGVYLHALGHPEARGELERALGLGSPAGMPAETFERAKERLRELLAEE